MMGLLMKRVFLLIVLVGITFLGCSDNYDSTNVSAPTKTNNFNKEGLLTSDLEIEVATHRLSITELIDGEVGGELLIDTTYVNYQGREINVFGKLTIKQSSFPGLNYITMILNPEAATIKLFPDIVFEKEVILSVIYTGIDLVALGYTTSGHYDFVYFGENGIEIILSDDSKVDMENQEIKVKNAKLEHFSRYGWIK